ncbi:MAG TPA: PTS sugar transporter subunit IIA [Thermoanaerobacterales bacterium]|jgi:PTS system mannitol-specific IIA component|nr:PTS sugar transporter subunit IIA [Thermoanaerobacterales bacterium]
MAFNLFRKDKKQNKAVEVLTENSIILGAEAKDKYEAIEIVGNILLREGKVEASYIDAMKAREDMLTTYIGNGVAIPHGVGEAKDKIIESGISVAQFSKGVDFGQGSTAYIVIGIAGKDNDHLNILANIAAVCEDKNEVEKLIKAKSRREIYQMLHGGDQQ